MNISINEIVVSLNNILIQYDAHGAEVEYLHSRQTEIINKQENSIAKEAIRKKYDHLIEAYKQESNNNRLSNEKLENIAKILKSYWLENYNFLYSELFKCLFSKNINTQQERKGIGFASFDCVEFTGNQVLKVILTTHIFLNKFDEKRFTQNRKNKEDKIKNLNKSLIIAKNYNNQSLVNEINTMIKLINQEDYITKEIIYKNCFYHIHQILIDKSNFWNDMKPLAKETKAKEIANQILEDFFMLKVQYKPSKKRGEKKFYELGSDRPRVFYYYLSK